MNLYTPNKFVERGGQHLRTHKGRYFYLKKTGWFVRTRGDLELSDGLEVVNGIVGPFKSRAAAKFHLLKIIYEARPELFTQI